MSHTLAIKMCAVSAQSMSYLHATLVFSYGCLMVYSHMVNATLDGSKHEALAMYAFVLINTLMFVVIDYKHAFCKHHYGLDLIAWAAVWITTYMHVVRIHIHVNKYRCDVYVSICEPNETFIQDAFINNSNVISILFLIWICFRRILALREKKVEEGEEKEIPKKEIV